MKPLYKILIGTALFLIVSGILIYVAVNRSDKENERYELIQPAHRDISRKISMPGELQPRSEISIKPQITGIVESLYVQEGDIVKVGDILARIRVIPDVSSLILAQSAVNTSKLSYEETLREFNRTKELYENKVVSQEEYERMQNTLNISEETVETALASLEIITEGITERSGKINTTEVRSSIDGTVISVSAKPGTSVVGTNTFGEGSTILTLANMREMQFLGYINEAEVEDIQVGMSTSLMIPAMHNLQIPATLTFIATKGVKMNGATLYSIQADAILDDSISIRAGYSASASFVLEEHKNVLSVPSYAIYYKDGRPCVWKLVSDSGKDKQVFELVPVKLGLSDGMNMEIVSGITADDLIKGLVL